jgi:nicotinate-nucleotide adenylyltransferase
MSVVLYGGAFDPVHAGHVFIAREALRLLAPSRLILIPTGNPNPEFDKRLSASDADRLSMLALAFAGTTGVEVSSIELTREPAPSYFADTLDALRPTLGPGRPMLLLGQDQLMSFDRWKRYQDILRQADLYYVPRAGLDAASLPPVPASRLFDVNPFDSLSSTLVRSRVQRGLFVDGLVPTGVADYIRIHGLYRPSVP